MNVITVKINGVEYNLRGAEAEDYLQRVAHYVDKKMKNIMDNNNKLSASSAAVLTAVNAVDDMFKIKEEYSQLAFKIKHFEDMEKKLREEIDILKKEVISLENENSLLNSELNTLQHKDILENQEEEITKLKSQLEIMGESSQNYLKENMKLAMENKELKFQLQSSKYKLINVQNKLVENQITLVKMQKEKSPLLNENVD